MDKPVLSTRKLELYYGNHPALKGIDMDIPEKKITALIGPSGCGKSTFLKTMNRMNDVIPGVKVVGSVQYRGREIYDPQEDVTRLRRQIGMVFQKPNPFPMSVYDNIAYGPRTHGIRRKARLDEIVERSLRSAAVWDEVKDRLKKSALGLSGGQQQRVCIARALAVEPDVLLMDEATSALDPISTSKIEELAESLKKDYTIVMVTHNMQQAARISDRTAFFLMGELAEIARYLEGSGAGSRIRIGEMAQATVRMVTESIDSFVRRDPDLARAVVAYDDVVDDLFLQIKEELTQLIRTGGAGAEHCLDLLMAAKYFERIGDHATNIAEWVEYSITGVHNSDERGSYDLYRGG